jgi:hypothetical protein
MLGKICKSQASIALTLLTAMLATANFASAKEYPLVTGRDAGEVSQVEVLLEVGGELTLQDEKDKKTHHLKTSVVGTLVYDEKLGATGKAAGETRGVRQYRRCDAVIKIDKGTTKARLRDDRRLVALATGERQMTLFSPSGPLTQEELDLITIPACSLLVEQLLPNQPVAPGDKWQHDDDLLAALLNLDAIGHSEVSTTFKEVTTTGAQLELAGTVHGAIDGVATEIELKGRYKFDLQQNRVTWFALLVKEKRAIGHVAPGVDVTARLQMKIAPGSTCPALADEVLADLSLTPQPEQMLLEYTSPEGQFQFLHDRAWHVVSEAGKTAALRLVDRGELVAQCNVSALPAGPEGKRFTLAKFQEDVQQSLGNHFKQFISAAESENSAGHNTCRVVASGEVETLPIQWNYYLVADARGQQVVLAFTMETDLVERFGASDASMLATLRFIDTKTETAAQPTVAPARK